VRESGNITPFLDWEKKTLLVFRFSNAVRFRISGNPERPLGITDLNNNPIGLVFYD
jgi:hypothetical protein